MAVADLARWGWVADAGGAAIGLWQPGLHKGFGVFGEAGTPAWFELFTRDYPASVAFYRDVFGWDTQTVGDTPEFRYTIMQHGPDQLAGIMDASAFLPEGEPARWSVYSHRRRRRQPGRGRPPRGLVIRPAEDTPYGRLAEAATRPASTSSSSPRTRPCPRATPEPAQIPDISPAGDGEDWRHRGGANPSVTVPRGLPLVCSKAVPYWCVCHQTPQWHCYAGRGGADLGEPGGGQPGRHHGCDPARPACERPVGFVP